MKKKPLLMVTALFGLCLTACDGDYTTLYDVMFRYSDSEPAPKVLVTKTYGIGIAPDSLCNAWYTTDPAEISSYINKTKTHWLRQTTKTSDVCGGSGMAISAIFDETSYVSVERNNGYTQKVRIRYGWGANPRYEGKSFEMLSTNPCHFFNLTYALGNFTLSCDTLSETYFVEDGAAEFPERDYYFEISSKKYYVVDATHFYSDDGEGNKKGYEVVAGFDFASLFEQETE